jgi:hypothetical protein
MSTLLKKEKDAALVILSGAKNLVPRVHAYLCYLLMLNILYHKHPGLLQRSEESHSVQNDKGWLGHSPLTLCMRQYYKQRTKSSLRSANQIRVELFIYFSV